MSNKSYENEGFESDGNNDDKRHQLKLSIDFLSVKDMRVSATLSFTYSIKLQSTVHSFTSSQKTPVNTSGEFKLQGGFASFDFLASKTELLELFSSKTLATCFLHHPSGTESFPFGTAQVDLTELMRAPLKKTPQGHSVRVCDQYVAIRDDQGSAKGLTRCIIYLQDMGEVAGNNVAAARQASNVRNNGQENVNPNNGQNNSEYQAVWQLELWKRAEEQKFKAWLKQREIERIEEITVTWKAKEGERERQFNDSMQRIAQLESKVRGKAIELQRREDRIVQLEEELKHKIAEVSRQLTVKEEEVVNVKKRFKEERSTLEADKKKLQAQIEELKARCEGAENRLHSLKRDIEESPLSVIRAELAQKNLELIESESKTKQAIEDRDEARRKFEQLKKDMVALKKQLDQEQKNTLLRQAEELEKLKNDIRNKQAQEEERREINSLKMQLTQLTNKLSERKAAPETINDRSQGQTLNPFLNQAFVPGVPATQTYGGITGPQSNIFLDNYAKQQASPMKSTLNAVPAGGTEIERLLREREELMRTGCYTQDDPLIQELDRQIRTNQLRILSQ